MELDIIKPIGPCNGVRNAIKQAISIKHTYPNNKIYLLGSLVHNDKVINELLDQGIYVLDAPFEQYENAIKNLPADAIIIFSAHGHDEKLDELCIQKGIKTFDTICPMVNKNRKLIKKYLQKGYKILYIGDKNHVETKAVISIDSANIKVFENLLDLYYFNTNQNIFVCLQTTLNYYRTKDLIEQIKQILPNAVISKEICPVTRIRQENMTKLSRYTDAILVIGDKNSSNTMKLLNIAKDNYPNVQSTLVEDENDIPKNITNKKHVAITSGTSAPDSLVQRVISVLNDLR